MPTNAPSCLYTERQNKLYNIEPAIESWVLIAATSYTRSGEGSEESAQIHSVTNLSLIAHTE